MAVVSKFAGFETGNFSELQTAGNLGQSATGGTITVSTEQAHSGTRSAKGVINSGSGNKFARSQWEVAWVENDDVVMGAWFYLPSGFKAAMQGQVDILRWDTFPTSERGGLCFQANNDLIHAFTFNGSSQSILSQITPFAVPETTWFKLTLRQRFSSTAPLTEVYLDDVLKGTSTEPNFHGDTITRLRTGIVAINSSTQTNALTNYHDDLTIEPYVEPVTLPEIISGPTKAKISREPGADASEVSWRANVEFQSYQIRAVDAADASVVEGTLLEQDQNPGPLKVGEAQVGDTLRTGGGTADDIYVAEITDDELVDASPGDGQKLLKLFVQDTEGNWSE